MQKAYAKVVERLLETMETNRILPWARPWSLPINAVSSRTYRGINFLVLATCDCADPRFLTYIQAKELGGHVRPGERGFPVVKWHFPTSEELQKNPSAKPWVRGYTVFNVLQCENLVKMPELPSVDRDPIASAQELVDKWVDKPRIEHGGYQAAYNPILDRVIVPETQKFRIPEAYYDTLFHELVHSTGHVSRLNRGLTPRFDSQKYGLEELVAEIGSAMLNAEAEIDSSNITENNAAYVQSWLRVIKGDPSMLIKATGMAAKAADLILGRTFQRDGESDEVEPAADVLCAA